ncbi:type II toxin-antitoxin system Phd/YefM family antitoxin [Oxalobacteraceae bacterium]|nr:type II toxin-antitoxin system Phd/YefM family antitoxin [Oxalobacteraceae bacterium]
MQSKQVSKSEFKAKALEFLRQVEASGENMVIADHGKPVLEVRRYRSADRNPCDTLKGAVVRYVDPTAPIDVEWDAARYSHSNQ